MTMRKLLILGAIALAGVSSSAFAQELILPSPFDATLTVNSNGTLEYQGAAYTEVLQQDKLFSDFSGLLTGSTVQFVHSVVNGLDEHTITFGDPFGTSGPGAIFNWSYDITITDPTKFSFANVTGDVLQTVGVATLVKNLTSQDGDPYLINFTKVSTLTNPPFYFGNVSAFLDNGDVTLTVAEKLTLGLSGSDATGVTNSFLETPTVPELSTWAMMGLGFVGLAFAGYRARKSVAIAA
jgi:hypothetical protein